MNTIIYMEGDQNGQLEVEIEELENVKDFINSLIDGGYKNFKLYTDCSNAGCFGEFAEVKDGEIISYDPYPYTAVFKVTYNEGDNIYSVILVKADNEKQAETALPDKKIIGIKEINGKECVDLIDKGVDVIDAHASSVASKDANEVKHNPIRQLWYDVTLGRLFYIALNLTLKDFEADRKDELLTLLGKFISNNKLDKECVEFLKANTKDKSDEEPIDESSMDTSTHDSIKDVDIESMHKLRNYSEGQIKNALKGIVNKKLYNELTSDGIVWADVINRLSGPEKEKLFASLDSTRDSIKDESIWSFLLFDKDLLKAGHRPTKAGLDEMAKDVAGWHKCDCKKEGEGMWTITGRTSDFIDFLKEELNIDTNLEEMENDCKQRMSRLQKIKDTRIKDRYCYPKPLKEYLSKFQPSPEEYIDEETKILNEKNEVLFDGQFEDIPEDLLDATVINHGCDASSPVIYNVDSASTKGYNVGYCSHSCDYPYSHYIIVYDPESDETIYDGIYEDLPEDVWEMQVLSVEVPYKLWIVVKPATKDK